MRNDQLRLTPTKLEKTSKKVAALHASPPDSHKSNRHAHKNSYQIK